MALSLIGSEKIRTALDLGKEPLALRDSYGMTLFGQSCLAARRLVEAGSRFVTVFWDEYGLAGSGWDTHWDHYPRMRDELLPGLDRAWAGLIASHAKSMPTTLPKRWSSMVVPPVPQPASRMCRSPRSLASCLQLSESCPL